MITNVFYANLMVTTKQRPIDIRGRGRGRGEKGRKKQSKHMHYRKLPNNEESKRRKKRTKELQKITKPGNS